MCSGSLATGDVCPGSLATLSCLGGQCTGSVATSGSLGGVCTGSLIPSVGIRASM